MFHPGESSDTVTKLLSYYGINSVWVEMKNKKIIYKYIILELIIDGLILHYSDAGHFLENLLSDKSKLSVFRPCNDWCKSHGC